MTLTERVRTDVLIRIGEATNRTLVLPLVVFSPTSRCNSRCISCDWWKQTGEDDLTIDEIDRLSADIAALGTRLVVFSGGEPLLRPEVFEAARLFRARGMWLQLLTSGILLERFAERVAQTFAKVYVSLDAADEALYERIRGVAALATIERGIDRLRRLAPAIGVTARATLHRQNFRELPRLIDHARRLGLDGISFLAADVSSASAFGRRSAADAQPLALDREEIAEFEAVIERTLASHHDAFASGFVAERPEKLRRLPRHYAAVAGLEPFPVASCNAPWVSVVIEANGSVRPCFFHDVIGNVRKTPLDAIVTRDLPAFRRQLRVGANPVCERCVCSLKTGWRNAPWVS
ncbi:MAG TPA: radical SAM protein [Vicinamibacterales bacterium]|nr:radical SAM protein [Vicinamibacterales bacterium]